MSLMFGLVRYAIVRRSAVTNPGLFSRFGVDVRPAGRVALGVGAWTPRGWLAVVRAMGAGDQ